MISQRCFRWQIWSEGTSGVSLHAAVTSLNHSVKPSIALVACGCRDHWQELALEWFALGFTLAFPINTYDFPMGHVIEGMSAPAGVLFHKKRCAIKDNVRCVPSARANRLSFRLGRSVIKDLTG